VKKQEILQELRERFKDEIVDFFEKSPKRVYIEIKPEAIVKIANCVFKEFGARFNIASGVDARFHMEILYHFTFDEIDLTLSIRTKLDKAKKLEIDSIANIIKGADWIEREIREMLGIDFKGHPNPKRLLLSDDWPEGVYPLRRDYKEWDKGAIRDRGAD